MRVWLKGVARAFSSGLSMRRISGGRSAVEGLYVETAARSDGWLFTLGARVDGWETANGHLTESVVATGEVTKQQTYPSRSGTLPTARLGVRRELGDGLYLRGAAYEGFRAPSLNELYRPFRVGQITTLANPALTPEKLYGTEVGIGGEHGAFTWDATVFWNQLHNAIANVTTGVNLQTRENACDINAHGIEADARYAIATIFAHGRVRHRCCAYKVISTSTGLLINTRPAQAPRWTATGGVDSGRCRSSPCSPISATRAGASPTI